VFNRMLNRILGRPAGPAIRIGETPAIATAPPVRVQPADPATIAARRAEVEARVRTVDLDVAKERAVAEAVERSRRVRVEPMVDDRADDRQAHLDADDQAGRWA
jgi:hypothetical protein